jgi:RNA polymerase sigma factor (TIGR02999 family)
MDGMSDATQLIHAINQGDKQATAELLPLVYDELKRLARVQMAGEGASHTLQATALVHEAYLRLVGETPAPWDGRRHFLAAAAEAMRRILIDYARAKHTQKRGGGRQRVPLDDNEAGFTLPVDNLDELLELDAALDRLECEDSSKAELVKLLHFAGLTLDEAAAALGVSRSAAYRQWLYARAWLRDAIAGQAKSRRPEEGYSPCRDSLSPKIPETDG